jgi:hypothetical protein
MPALQQETQRPCGEAVPAQMGIERTWVKFVEDFMMVIFPAWASKFHEQSRILTGKDVPAVNRIVWCAYNLEKCLYTRQAVYRKKCTFIRSL